MLEISRPHDFPRRTAIAGATDAPRPTQEPHRESERPVEPLHPFRCLIDDDYRPIMPRQQLRRPFLIAPREAASCVLGELNVVRRIRIDEIAGAKRERFDITAHKCPTSERLAVGRKVALVTDPRVSPERHVEKPASIEAAQSIEPCSIQIVEERRRFLALSVA